ncbi:hypothetical protein [Photobacterium galatheae]|uniref:Uncharacterized protein n=1 Tax=Photobacterium galatheae TaxID=1654360 RepID=A0A066RTV7_9GAMM|nr:hypothetical protein [Photobacterium galatheae]KDM91117.1 hypothetical protein EA58_13275 [Photobacterium galatheae]
MESVTLASGRGIANITAQLDEILLMAVAALKFVAVFMNKFVEKRAADPLRHTFTFAVRAHMQSPFL